MGRELIGRGERAPDFGLPRGPDGTRTRFYGMVGGTPAAVVLSGADVDGAIAEGHRLRAVDPGLDVHVIVHADATTHDQVFTDPTGGVHDAYGVAVDRPSATVVLTDRNVRVDRVVDGGELDVDALDVDVTPPDRPRVRSGFAPVLLVPGAVQPGLRHRLLAAFAAADPEPGAVETTADGRRDEALDHLRKRRRDMVIEDPDLLRTVTQHVGRRVIPEVARAFAFRADRFEGFKIGAYDEHDEGYFAAHRDNISPSTRHRRFGLSINLDDDFDGGQLRFPEYGPDLYSPAAGEALVFSGSLLHEVLLVSRGRRHVLLSFLFAGTS